MSILRLKELLKEKSITGKELAEKVDITENAISMIINNKRQPRFELLLQIAEVLNVDVRDLFNPTKDASIEKQLYIKNDNGDFEKFGVLKLYLNFLLTLGIWYFHVRNDSRKIFVIIFYVFYFVLIKPNNKF